MNILFITDLVPTGGSKTYFFNATRELIKQGYKVSLIGFTEQIHPDLQSIQFESVKLLYIDNLRAKSIGKRIYLLLRALQAASAVQTPDGVVLDLVYPAFSLQVIRTVFRNVLKDIPILYQFHGLDSLERSYGRVSRSFFSLQQIKLYLDLWILNNVPNKIIVFSLYSKSILQKMGVKTSIQHIQPGVDEELVRSVKTISKKKAREILSLSDKGRFALIASRLEPRKGVLHFFQSLPKEKIKYQEITFLVASDFFHDEYTYEFFQVLSKKKMGPKILCMTEPCRNELALLYRAADATIFPSLGLETFGLVALESHSIGTPVIGYQVGALPEIIDEELLTTTGDESGLLDKVVMVMNESTSKKERRSTQLKKKTKKYNWTTYVESMMRLIKDI